MKKQSTKQGFVCLQTKDTKELLRLDSINKIDMDIYKATEAWEIDSIMLYINDEHWESFDGENLSWDFEGALQGEILQAINNELRADSGSIDLDLLVHNCIEKFKK